VLDFLGHIQLSDPCATLHHELQARYANGHDAKLLDQHTKELEDLLELVVAKTNTLKLPLSRSVRCILSGCIAPRVKTKSDTVHNAANRFGSPTGRRVRMWRLMLSLSLVLLQAQLSTAVNDLALAAIANTNCYLKCDGVGRDRGVGDAYALGDLGAMGTFTVGNHGTR
jgi:hypothetical protein